ncbi:hypothetical protein C2G38_2215711 [Gigaspora rosea]|uniref:Uncharacterized protein n=1 Tax=Gigaspora rosea TaxID=44941 RepID=A0A397U9W6_9GLOM|nr:hypothetical protein C2G38_2215711 [Gigaspora rosea]
MARLLYNGVTNNRNVESKVIVSYKNKNNKYSAMKNNLKKTVLSGIGRLKIRSKNFHHILASDIEWTYVSNDPLLSSTKTNAKGISEIEFDEHLDGIEEKYATLTSQVPQKRQNTRQNINLRQCSSINNSASTSQNTNQHILSRATRVEDEKDTAFVSDDDPTEVVQLNKFNTNESNYHFRDGQYSSALTSSESYETNSILNTISELNDESFTYDGQTVSTSMSSQVLSYKMISTLNTVAELDDESLTYNGQNGSILTSPRVPCNSSPYAVSDPIRA